jgi:predicted aspartyl protease
VTPLVAVALVLLCASPLAAQDQPPVIQARSKVVTIIDGQHEKKDYWYVMPERSPEVYYAELPRVPHRVTFVTDLDAISFDVTYESRHAFVIQLADGTMTTTEIRAEYRQLLPYRRIATGASDEPAQIPFTLGDNDKIYVTGSINGGPPLGLQVDFGAGGTLIKKASVSKVAMTFDESITLRNSDGEHVVPSSSRNTIDIAGLRWEDVPIAVADNMTHREDAIVGNTLFQDRVVAIDYDRMVLAIQDTLPDVSGWQRTDMILDGVIPFVRGELEVGGQSQEGWFMLDTGASTSILRHERLSSTSKFRDELRRLLGPLGGDVQGPVVHFANQTFSGMNYAVTPYEGTPSELGLLGNDVLKRLNIVVDNRLGAVYLRPNSRATDGFRNPERLVVRTAAIVGLIAAAVVTYRRRR